MKELKDKYILRRTTTIIISLMYTQKLPFRVMRHFLFRFFFFFAVSEVLWILVIDVDLTHLWNNLQLQCVAVNGLCNLLIKVRIFQKAVLSSFIYLPTLNTPCDFCDETSLVWMLEKRPTSTLDIFCVEYKYTLMQWHTIIPISSLVNICVFYFVYFLPQILWPPSDVQYTISSFCIIGAIKIK